MIKTLSFPGYYHVHYLRNGIIIKTNDDSIKKEIKTHSIFSQVLERLSQEDFFDIPNNKRIDLYVHLDKEIIETPIVANRDDKLKYPSPPSLASGE